MYWIDSYIGLLDLITTDIGKNFINKEFKYYVTTLRITTKSVLIKSHNSIRMVERYHGPLQQAY